MSEAEAVAASRRTLSQRNFNRLILTVLGIGLAALAVLGGAIVWLGVRTADYNGWVEHTYVAEQAIVSFQADIERMETGRRGYLLAPSAEQYSRYTEARAQIAKSIFAVSNVTGDNPVQRANLAKMRPMLAWKINNSDESVRLARLGRPSEALKAFKDEQTLQPMIGIRLTTKAMLDEEKRLLAERSKRERDNTDVLLKVALATALLLALLAVIAILAMRRFTEDLSHAQRELRQLNEALEERVKERTADLTRANEEIQRFAYIVSHDLRSPLVNVMGFTSELEVGMKPLRALVRWIEERDVEGRLPQEVKTAVDQDIPEAIDFIRSSTRKMDRLISAILRLSREGRRVLHPEPLNLKPMVEGILATVQHQLIELGGAGEVEGELPPITADRLALEQVLGNLVDNAVKYHSPKRPLRIAVRGYEQFGRVVIEVEDNGRGIDPRDHERIFELFRRSGAQNQPGEGIGLAHVRALVHRMGGSITVASALDQGATFRLSLPKTMSLAEGMAA